MRCWDAVQTFVWENGIKHKLGLMKVWHIKEFWINCLILLSNQIRFFWIRGWSLLSDCVLYIGHGIYTVIVGRHWSCSPSFLSAAVQLLSFVILSCLSHKHTQTHTHYSSKMMEAMFDKITLWSKRCFLFFRADSSVQWFIHVGQLHECDIKRHNIRSLCLSLSGLLFPYYCNSHCQNILKMFSFLYVSVMLNT